ncbi:hypothetical protein MesoLj113b_68360 (plasmid) [Mesorhizobium sp. 113-3-3]|nr:hypothetical protein MesoLj113b_68360 [Mesorhizobium sp. 113-3-3]
MEGVAVAWDQGGLVLTYDERAFREGGPSNWPAGSDCRGSVLQAQTALLCAA